MIVGWHMRHIKIYLSGILQEFPNRLFAGAVSTSPLQSASSSVLRFFKQ